MLGALENYHYALTSDIMLQAFVNNLVWMIVMVSGCVLFGLLIALLANRVKYEVHRQIDHFPADGDFVRRRGRHLEIRLQLQLRLDPDRPAERARRCARRAARLLADNASGQYDCADRRRRLDVHRLLHGDHLRRRSRTFRRTFSKRPDVDGANAWQNFWNIILPTIMPTLIVVTTTMIINVLKIFDIVYIMTGGNYGTDVIANRMYKEQYQAFNTGRAAAIAVVLIIAGLARHVHQYPALPP